MELAQKSNEDAGDYKETLDKMNKGEIKEDLSTKQISKQKKDEKKIID